MAHKISVSFKDWVVGSVVVAIFALAFWGMSVLVAPNSHFTLLECWGLVMMGVVLNTGRMTYRDNQLEEDADISE